MAIEPEELIEAKPKGKKRWILVGAVVLLIAAGAAYPTYRYFRNRPASSSAATKGKGAQPAKEKKAEIKALLPLDPFLVNLADKEDIRFVKATFQLGLTEPMSEEKNPAAHAAMRDAIISILTSRTSDQILSPEGKENLRQEIRKRINELAPKLKVQDVFIVDFVVQL